MDYKVDDEFLDKVDTLIDSVMELSQASEAINSMGIALVNLKKLEQVRENATELCDEMEDGLPDCEERKDDENGSESETDTKECANSGDDDPAAICADPDGDGSGYVAY
ncbi:hypothetical protein [Acidaminococcus provencensis]|uniref:hypothetical protein n=1 Tax=Acidaminococcus provencensis TaxID=2058289 RepID=UPI0022E4DC93|nr:hypothetical protein [Acidaminococcus provencensis]